jgi:hypothetical protein
MAIFLGSLALLLFISLLIFGHFVYDANKPVDHPQTCFICKETYSQKSMYVYVRILVGKAKQLWICHGCLDEHSDREIEALIYHKHMEL